MFRRSRMNQSRLPPVEQLLFIHKVTGSARAWRHLAPYILPSDICELHTSARAHTGSISHLTLPCRTLSITAPLKFTTRKICTGLLDGGARLSIACGRIHKRWRLCQLKENLSFPISQKGIMRLITYIVI